MVVTKQSKSRKINWEDLMKQAGKETFGSTSFLRPSWKVENIEKGKFLRRLFSNGRTIYQSEPEEISKTTVDVNEKIYENHDGSEDTTTIKLVNSTEDIEGHNYVQTTKKGIEWGLNANIGLQFGIPQIGGSNDSGAKLGVGFKKSKTTETTKAEKKVARLVNRAHNEEIVTIPPKTRVIVKMTSYRVRYKTQYTMEYKIDKTAGMEVLYDRFHPYLLLVHPWAFKGVIKAPQLLHSLPDYREDEKYVYFTQEGELRWITDRMEVKKEVYPL